MSGRCTSEERSPRAETGLGPIERQLVFATVSIHRRYTWWNHCWPSLGSPPRRSDRFSPHGRFLDSTWPRSSACCTECFESNWFYNGEEETPPASWPAGVLFTGWEFSPTAEGRLLLIWCDFSGYQFLLFGRRVVKFRDFMAKAIKINFWIWQNIFLYFSFRH